MSGRVTRALLHRLAKQSVEVDRSTDTPFLGAEGVSPRQDAPTPAGADATRVADDQVLEDTDSVRPHTMSSKLAGDRIKELITDGSIEIRSIDVFSRIVSDNPGEPDLLRIYAGLLERNHQTAEAAQAYQAAAAVFFTRGMAFKGWLCKLLEHRLRGSGPGHMADARKVIRATAPAARIDEFVQHLDTDERLAVFSKFSIISSPPGRHFNTGEVAREDLHIVISGVLRRRGGSNPGVSQADPFTLKEGDFFGFDRKVAREPFPLCEVVSVSRVEIMKISDRHLEKVFRRYPGAGEKLQVLMNSGSAHLVSRQSGRRCERCRAVVPIDLTLHSPEPAEPALRLRGVSRDVSHTGIYITADASDPCDSANRFRDLSRFIDRDIELQVIREGISVRVHGKVARAQNAITSGDALPGFGVRFVNLTPSVQSMLFVFVMSADSVGTSGTKMQPAGA